MSKTFTRLCDTVAQNSGKANSPIKKKNKSSYIKNVSVLLCCFKHSNIVLFTRYVYQILKLLDHAEAHLLEIKYTYNIDSSFAPSIFIAIFSRFTATSWKCWGIFPFANQLSPRISVPALRTEKILHLLILT